MSRELDMNLVEFCAGQHLAFDPSAWENRPEIPAETLAAAAAFLALDGESWFGHTRELDALRRRLAPDIGFVAIAASARFDYQRFRGLLRARLRHACALS